MVDENPQTADSLLLKIQERKEGLESDLVTNFIDGILFDATKKKRVVKAPAPDEEVDAKIDDILKRAMDEGFRDEVKQIIEEHDDYESAISIDISPQGRNLAEPVHQGKAKKRHTKRRVLRIVRNTSISFLCITFVLFVGLLAFNIRSEYKGKENFASLREEKSHSTTEGEETEGGILSEYASLYAQNHDMVGWLSIGLTPVDYPVVFKENDNDYYLTRNFNDEYDANGMLILDKRCDPRGGGNNLLIHGHNMRSGLMFGSLRRFMDQGYAADHKYINYDTLTEKRRYEVISVFISSVDAESTEDFKYYDYINITNEVAFNEYISGIKGQSIYETDTTATYGDKLITLSTCDSSKNEGRLVVVGKQVEL